MRASEIGVDGDGAGRYDSVDKLILEAHGERLKVAPVEERPRKAGTRGIRA